MARKRSHREKATITLDRSKAAEARTLTGAASVSDVIDLALDRLVQALRLQRDIAAYRQVPPTDVDVELALMGDVSGLDDDTDWEALYAEGRS